MNTLDSERYDISSYVGRTGLEAAYEDTLCGTKGYSLDIYASDGQWLSTVARKEAVDGLDLERAPELETLKGLVPAGNELYTLKVAPRDREKLLAFAAEYGA